MTDTPYLVAERVEHDLWDVKGVVEMHSGVRKKTVAQFCQDVDGEWLLFISARGALRRRDINELSALFSAFQPNSHPEGSELDSRDILEGDTKT